MMSDETIRIKIRDLKSDIIMKETEITFIKDQISKLEFMLFNRNTQKIVLGSSE